MVIKSSKVNNGMYLEVDLDRLQSEIFLKRHYENGVFSLNPQRIVTEDNVKFLVMSDDTRKLIISQSDMETSSLTREPYTEYLFGVPIAICEGLVLGRIEIVGY